MPVCAVCTDPVAARLVHAAGVAVVLLGVDGAELGRAAVALAAAGPGRVAVFVGDGHRAGDLDAARAMAEEQFRLPAVVVTTPADATSLLASLPGHGG
jgi:hypothetical protein